MNRLTTRLDRRLREGDEVELGVEAAELPQFAAPVAPTAVAGWLPPVLAEDASCLVVDKPAGMATIPDRSGREAGVYGRLTELRPTEDLRIIHRLDRGTSGCLGLAKGLAAARFYDLAFREHRVRKEYLALVEGEPAVAEFEVTAWLGPDRRRPGKVKTVAEDSRGARSAATAFAVVERFHGFTLLRAMPRTGRSHQIRVHLAHRGHPILGDEDYGGRPALLLSELKRSYKTRPGVAEPPVLARMFLHASRLVLPGCDGAAPIDAVAPLPAELEQALTKLRHFAARES